MVGSGKDLHPIPIQQDVLQRHHASVDFGAHAVVADLSVDGIREVNGCHALGQTLHVPFGREYLDAPEAQLALQASHEFPAVTGVLMQLHHAAQESHLVDLHAIGDAAFFVGPMGSDARFSVVVHFLRADLEFKGIARGHQHRGMNALISVVFGQAYVVLETSRNRLVQRVDKTHGGIA